MVVSFLISYPTRNAFGSRVLGTLQLFRYDSRVTSQDWLAPTALIVRQVRRGPEGIARPKRTEVGRKARRASAFLTRKKPSSRGFSCALVQRSLARPDCPTDRRNVIP